MKLISRLLALLCSIAPAFTVAGSFTQAQDPVVLPLASADISMRILFTGDGHTQDGQLELTVSSMQGLVITTTVLVPGSVCTVDPVAARLRIQPASVAGVALPLGAVAYCSFSFNVAADATVGPRTLVPAGLACEPLGPSDTCTFAGQGILILGELPIGVPTITGVYVGSTPALPITAGTTRQVGFVDLSIIDASVGTTVSVTCADDAGGPQLTIAPASQTG
jgi:hypothetical protein